MQVGCASDMRCFLPFPPPMIESAATAIGGVPQRCSKLPLVPESACQCTMSTIAEDVRCAPGRRARMRVRNATRVAIIVVTTFLAMLLFASPVFAFDETTTTAPQPRTGTPPIANDATPRGRTSTWSGDPYGVHAGYAT